MKHHGRATITYNGMRIRSKPGATLNLGGTSRAPEPLDDGTVGYAESTAAPELSCTVPLTADLAVEDLRDLVNATIGFVQLAEITHKPSKCLHRMLSPKGNPSMDNLAAIFGAVGEQLNVGFRVRTAKAA